MTLHSRQPRPRCGRRRPAPGRADAGSVAVEIALSVPLGILLVFLVAAALHLARAAIDVNAAAAAAARAASLSRTAPTATTAATAAATTTLAGHCTTVAVSVDAANFHRGGTVTVTVACTVSTRALTGISLPGTLTASATSTSPLDVYRTAAGFTITEAGPGANRRGGRR